jgi:hypothetical protein
MLIVAEHSGKNYDIYENLVNKILDLGDQTI